MPKHNAPQILAAYALCRISQAYPMARQILSVRGRVSDNVWRQIILAVFPTLPSMAGEIPILMRFLLAHLESNGPINWALARRYIQKGELPRKPTDARTLLFARMPVSFLSVPEDDTLVTGLFPES